MKHQSTYRGQTEQRKDGGGAENPRNNVSRCRWTFALCLPLFQPPVDLFLNRKTLLLMNGCEYPRAAIKQPRRDAKEYVMKWETVGKSLLSYTMYRGARPRVNSKFLNLRFHQIVHIICDLHSRSYISHGDKVDSGTKKSKARWNWFSALLIQLLVNKLVIIISWNYHLRDGIVSVWHWMNNFTCRSKQWFFAA